MYLIREINRGIRVTIVLVLTLAFAVVSSAQVRQTHERYAIFVSQRNGAAELYVIDLETKQVSQLTNTGRGHLNPSISIDNRQIVFSARTGSSYEIFRGEIGSAWRTNRPRIVGLNRLTVNPMDETSPSLTRDGSWLTFASGYGIELMSSNGTGRRIIVPVEDGINNLGPIISPDGTRVAFVSNRGGAYDIWLHTRATGEVRQLTSGAAVLGGLSWSSDSGRIAFTTEATDSKLQGVAIADAVSGGFSVVSDQNDSNPSLSSGGDRLLFTSQRDGDPELYLMNLITGRVERLTRSTGLDDAAVFLSEPALPARSTP